MLTGFVAQASFSSDVAGSVKTSAWSRKYSTIASTCHWRNTRHSPRRFQLLLPEHACLFCCRETDVTYYPLSSEYEILWLLLFLLVNSIEASCEEHFHRCWIGTYFLFCGNHFKSFVGFGPTSSFNNSTGFSAQDNYRIFFIPWVKFILSWETTSNLSLDLLDWFLRHLLPLINANDGKGNVWNSFTFTAIFHHDSFKINFKISEL